MRTPGPWEVRFYKDGRASLLASVKHDSAIVIADMVMSGHVKPDADFIVEACNAHDSLTAKNARLREALERAVQDLDSGWAEDADAHFPWLPDARAALAGGEK